MKIGDIIDCDGVKRIVTSFSTVGVEEYPNTEIYIGECKNEVVEISTLSEEKPVEITSDDVKSEEFVCPYCGKICASTLGLNAHIRHCKKNPANQK